jgi:hypothetical protein
MITLTEFTENHTLFDRYCESFADFDSPFELVCEDLEFDPEIMLYIDSAYGKGMGAFNALSFMHGFLFAIWLVREKRGL